MEKNYHIHVTIDTPLKGWKETIIHLEKGDKKQIDKMFTQHYKGFKTVEEDIKDIMEQFYIKSKRFKIELLNNPMYITEYSKEKYRENHIKLIINKEEFDERKKELLDICKIYNFVLSNNPKEILEKSITQFLNVRFLEGTYDESQIHLNKVISKLKEMNFEIKEVKEEISVFDSNFILDSWWAH